MPKPNRKKIIRDTMKIPLNKPFIVGKELYYMAQAVIEAHLSGDGPFTKKCHQWIEQRLGCEKALLTHSCTAALEMSAILCDIEVGDEVIMPSFTFVSTANAFVLRGAVPVFIDIRPDTLNINQELIEEAITPRTKAIVPVHYAGAPCAMNEIMHIADKHQLLVIEDAAQALLSTYQGKYLGTIGHLGCLSFHETKNIISGEGGALLINIAKYIERAEIIREKGTNRSKYFRGEINKYTWLDIGSSYLPSELVGAFLYAQLEQAEMINAVRCKIFQKYYGLLLPLEELGYVRLPFIDDGCNVNGHIFYIITENGFVRDRLIEYLRKKGIYAAFHYIPLHSSPGGLRYGRVNGNINTTNDISNRLMRLPLYYGMDERDVAFIVKHIKGYYQY